jgi:small subunit ribosomal protein S9
MTEPGTTAPGSNADNPEEGQPVTTPEPEIEAVEEANEEAAVEEAAVEAEAVAVADAADDFEAEVGIPAEIPVVLSERPVQTVGRRKEAVVRVRLVPGTGNFRLNGKSLETYFPNKLHQQLIREPLVTVEKTERFDIFANLQGGGTSGQAGALRLAIARALVEVDSGDRPPLKRAGFLTRDARATERKKYGLKKARKAPQYSKR